MTEHVPDYGSSVRTHWHMRPRALARHRTATKGRRVVSFTTAECLEAQAQVVLATARYRGAFPKGTAVGIGMRFDCVRHPWRGDIDNLGKLVLDAMRTGRLGKLKDGSVLEAAGVYHDDRQVRLLHLEVHTVATPADEGVHLHMYPLLPVEVT
jgi:Holliday junction resolvase RusA-like endonuclease